MVNNDVCLLRVDKVTEYYYGDILFKKNNIPYTIDIIQVGNYALCFPKYYDLSAVPRLSVNSQSSNEQKFEMIFEQLSAYSYVSNQPNPQIIASLGGDCQAFAIYLKTEFDRNNIIGGLIPFKSHVYNWVVLNNRVYKVDLTTSEVSAISNIDREKLLLYYPELVKYQ